MCSIIINIRMVVNFENLVNYMRRFLKHDMDSGMNTI